MKSSFDLDTYLVKKEDDVNDVDGIPSWVSHGTGATKVLYDSVLKRRDEIKKKINEGEKLSVTERKIINRHLALGNKLDPSILNKRRQPELIDFIDAVNEYLSELYSSKNKKKGKGGVKGLTRTELEKEVVSLRRANKKIEQKFCKDSIELALEKVFVKNQMQLSQEITELRKLLEEKNGTISELRNELRKYQVNGV